MAEVYGFASSLQEAKLLLDNGIRLIQFRNKSLSEVESLWVAKRIVDLANCYQGARVIINDKVSLALETGAHGVHLGQDDGDYPSLIRELKGRLHVGVSIDTVEEALEAQEAGADYIGAGAVFGSQTKPEAPYMGLGLLKDICDSVHCPVSAIGGITLESLPLVLKAGAHFICVISDINNHPDPPERIRGYLQTLEEYQ